MGDKLKSLWYKRGIEQTPSDPELKQCQIESHTDEASGISTIIYKNGQTPAMKSLRIIISEGIAAEVSELTVYAAGG